MDSDSEDFQSADEDVEIESIKKLKEKSSICSSATSGEKSVVVKENISEVKSHISKKIEPTIALPDPKSAPKVSVVDDGWEIEDSGDEAEINVNKVPETHTNQEKKTLESNRRDENITNVMGKLTQEDQPSQSWGWGSKFGGAFSLISSASKNVASITTQVSQSLTSVIESGLGVPNPEEFAKMQLAESEKLKAEKEKDGDSEKIDKTAEKDKEDIFGLNQIVSGVSQISSKVISGGLDTLEGIGKKTMNMLQDGDPGLKNKRNILGFNSDKTVLSQVST